MDSERDLSPRQVRWKLTGSAVDDGRASVDDVVRILASLQAAVRHMAEAIEDETRGRRRGPATQRLSSEITLRFVDIEHGSFAAVLELPVRGDQSRMFDLGEDALDRLLATLEAVSESGDLTGVPEVVLPEVRQLTSTVGGGIDSITFEGGKTSRHHARFTAAPSARTPDTISQRRSTSISGRLREVDFKDHTAELYDATNRMTKVVFTSEQERDLMTAANLYVTVSGEAEPIDNGRQRLHLNSIEAGPQGTEFWQHGDVSALAREQGVEALAKGQLGKADFWPDGLDAAEFIAVVYAERHKVDAAI